MTPVATTERRGVLQKLGAALLGALLPTRRAKGQAPPPVTGNRPLTADGHVPKWGMAIDLDLCTACGGCVVACASENNLPIPVDTSDGAGTGISWMELVAQREGADGVISETAPMPCMHCEDPPCTKVCPVGATYADEEGLVIQVWDRCIGCRYCTAACPYSRRYYNWSKPEFPDDLRNLLNPDVATRPEGVVEKCTFCVHRLRKTKETVIREGRTLTDDDVVRLPACAQSCPAHAITFGDLADPESRVARAAASPRASRLLEHLGTKPKVYYLSKDRRSSS